MISLAHEFLDPHCRPSRLDIYGVRLAIRRALLATLPRLTGSLLDVGRGYMPYRDVLIAPAGPVRRYLGLDLPGNGYAKPDVEWDGKVIPLPDATFDSAMATEVFEHCPDPESTMREIARVLRPSGVLFLTVPFLWPLHCVPHDEYRYTPYSLERHLRRAGFEAITLTALGGWDASLAQMLGLWVRRRPLQPRVRWLLSGLVTPLVWFLTRRDRSRVDFARCPMITGLSGTATKGSPLAAV